MRAPPFLRSTAIAILVGSLTSFANGQEKTGQAPGEKYALLVGIREYDKNELRNLAYAEADVNEMAKVLKTTGFGRVVLMTQTEGAQTARYLPLAANIRKELKGLLANKTEDDSVIIAFAGHGVQFTGKDESFFCPMDAKLSDPKTLISLEEVYQELEKCKAGVKFLFVDACRNNPQSDYSRARVEVELESVTRPQRKEPPKGVAALFSCSAGEKAFESPTFQHGIFFHYVLDALRGNADFDQDDKISWDELVTYTRKKVSDRVKEEFGADLEQKPQQKGSVSGLLILANVNRVLALIGKGNAAYEKGETDQAITHFNEVLRLDPKHVGTLVARSKAYYNKDDYDKAIADAAVAIRLDPKNFLAFNSRGNGRYSKGEYDQAIADYSSAIALQPDDAVLWSNRGDAYRRKHAYDQALAEYDESIRLNPNRARAFHHRGKTYYAKDHYVKAIADYSEAIRLDPTASGPYNDRGDAYYLKKNNDQAIADYNEAIRVDPKSAVGYYNRAFTYSLGKSDYDRAIADFSEAIRIDPNYSAAYNYRGDAYYMKEEYDQAIEDYTQAIRAYPNYAKAFYNRGLTYLRKKDDPGRALTDAAAAIRIDSNYANAYELRGDAYYEREDWTKAVAAYSEWIRCEPKIAKPYLERAKAYIARAIGKHKNNDLKAAEADFRRAVADSTEGIRLEPDNYMCYDLRATAYTLIDPAKAEADKRTVRRLRK